MNRFLWPLAIFVLLLVLLAAGLKLVDQRELPSPLVGKPAPAFRLARLEDPEKSFSPQEMQGQVWLLNVWASWCVSCNREHAKLLLFVGKVPVVGLNYKEVRGDAGIEVSRLSSEAERQLASERAVKWLRENGNPYVASVLDLDGRVGIDYGVYGVPETFIIDRQGIIRFKQVGPLTPETIEQKILPLLSELQGSQK
ncbi:MAG: periplasmic protein thiol/disulfide oxidoreductase DsbE [Proteobacteria bacterium]|nr:periplasmic protein thiol/disulfide oxidoreductase DsbE [Pseudomonadota bacterium]